jgi:hypothetical protein
MQIAGPENNYGYAFNTGPMDMNRYAGYPAHPQSTEVSTIFHIKLQFLVVFL